MSPILLKIFVDAVAGTFKVQDYASLKIEKKNGSETKEYEFKVVAAATEEEEKEKVVAAATEEKEKEKVVAAATEEEEKEEDSTGNQDENSSAAPQESSIGPGGASDEVQTGSALLRLQRINFDEDSEVS